MNGGDRRSGQMQLPSLAIAADTAVVLPGIPGAIFNGGVDVSVPKAGASWNVP